MEDRVQINEESQLDRVQGVRVHPSLEDRAALRIYMQEMSPRTDALSEEITAIDRLVPHMPPPWPSEIVGELFARFAALGRHVDDALIVAVPSLGLQSHPKWLRGLKLQVVLVEC